MKIKESVLNELLQKDGIEFEKFERVPFFKYSDGDTITLNEVETLVEETYATYEYDGKKYFKMGSVSKDPDGSFNGGEPTSFTMGNSYSLELQSACVEQFGEGISPTAMMEIRRVDAMTPIEYREHVREQLEAESKPGAFTFVCAPKGVDLEYCIDDSDRIDLLGQMALGVTEFEVHDVKRINSEPYNQVELAVIMTTLATVTKMHKYPIDAKIKALYELAEGFTREDVDNV